MRRSAPIATLALFLLAAGCSDSSGPEGVYGCDSVARYEIGETVNGAIQTGDCDDPDESGLADYYTFSQSAAGPVSVVVEVPEGSTTMYVVLLNEFGDVVDARFVGPGEESSVGGQLHKGSYVIAVGAQTPGPQNPYTLSSVREILLSRPPFLTCAESQDYVLGASVDGTLASGDCETPEDGWMDRYQFTLATARTVTIHLTSGSFDSFLYLFNSEGGILARNDDVGGGVHSRIIVSLPAGTYSIGVASFNGEGEGAYTVVTQ